MAQLRLDYERFTEKNAVIISIGPENARAFKDYWQKNELPFIGLPDENYSVLKLYGQEIKLFKFGRMPAQMLVDKKGMVRFVHYGHDMTDIPPNEELLSLLDKLEQEEAE